MQSLHAESTIAGPVRPQEPLRCRGCGWQGSAESARLHQTGPHLRADCNGCGQFIKFVAVGAAVLHFGKHRGRPVSDIAKLDPQYLRWLMGPSGPRLSTSLRTAILEALGCVQ